MTYVKVGRNYIGCAGASLTMEQGARAYDKAALFLFGAETEVNFRPEDYQEEICFVRILDYLSVPFISTVLNSFSFLGLIAHFLYWLR